MAVQQPATRSTGTTNLAEILERVLDKGIVIAGDIKLFLGEVEILTLQIRLVIASVDKAREMGMDWWVNNPNFSSAAAGRQEQQKQVETLSRIEERLGRLEESMAKEADH